MISQFFPLLPAQYSRFLHPPEMHAYMSEYIYMRTWDITRRLKPSKKNRQKNTKSREYACYNRSPSAPTPEPQLPL